MNAKYSIVTVTLFSIAIAGCGREARDGVTESTTPKQLAAQAERQIEKAGVVLDDAMVTAKVKTALIVAPDLKGLAIDVDTLSNVVTLSGTVASDSLRQQAERLAKSVDGVKDVKNNLMVKQPS